MSHSSNCTSHSGSGTSFPSRERSSRWSRSEEHRIRPRLAALGIQHLDAHVLVAAEDGILGAGERFAGGREEAPAASAVGEEGNGGGRRGFHYDLLGARAALAAADVR